MDIHSHWKVYTSNLSSPDIFLDWSFYYMIGASLQRRVWIGDIDGQPLFLNLYVVLTGDPGTGKGLAIKPTNQFLTHWKKVKNNGNYFDVNEYDHVSKKLNEEPTLIQVAPNATTYEALCRSMSRSISAYHPPAKPDGTIAVPYPHSSLCFTLEELASLVRKHADDVINFLLQAYDCSSYSYESVGRGKDFIKNPCLSLLAGTTFDFLNRVFGTKDALLGGGFASRVHFIVGKEPRFRAAFPIPMTNEQRESAKVVLEHIKKLTEVYGRIDFGEDAIKYFNDWWKNDEEKSRINHSHRLKDYYARKNIAVIKLAAILWFADNTSLKVVNGIEYIKKSIAIHAEAEKEMASALTLDGKNPVAGLAKEIAKDLSRNGGKTLRDIVIDHFGDAPEGSKSIKEAVEFLVSAKKIRLEDKHYKAIIE